MKIMVLSIQGAPDENRTRIKGLGNLYSIR